MRRLISFIALAVCSACADKSQSSDTTAAADTSAIGQTTSGIAGGAVQQGLLDPNTATREQLLALTMDSAATIVLISRRPYADMLAVDRVLSPRLNEAQRKALYAKLFKPIDLNTATAAEILLIPGVGPRMRHEFEEYRPYTSMEQFRREIGKYVDKDEVARLEQYVTVKR